MNVASSAAKKKQSMKRRDFGSRVIRREGDSRCGVCLLEVGLLVHSSGLRWLMEKV